MKLSKEQVQKIAKLSRLQIEEKDIQTYQEKLSSILDYVEKLQELDTSDVPEMQHSGSQTNVFRADEVEVCEEGTHKRCLDNFPQRKGDLLEVQAVFEEHAE